VILTPGQFRTSVLTGAARQGFLDRAQQQGYGPVKFKTYQVIPDLNAQCRQGDTPVLVNSPVSWTGLRIKTLIEKAVFRAFAGPPLMPFWKITDLGVLHDWVPLQPQVIGGSTTPPVVVSGTFSVSGYTMVNNPFQPPLQAPERTIIIERTTRFSRDQAVLCVDGAGLPPPPSPAFRSVTVVGPDGRNPLEAYPPR
jgi:hypothetical protein